MPQASIAPGQCPHSAGRENSAADAAGDKSSGAAKHTTKEVVRLTADSSHRTKSAPAALAKHKAEDDEDVKVPRLSAWTAFLCLLAVAQARPGLHLLNSLQNSLITRIFLYLDTRASLLCLGVLFSCPHNASPGAGAEYTCHLHWKQFGNYLGLRFQVVMDDTSPWAQMEMCSHRWCLVYGQLQHCVGGHGCSRGPAVARGPLPGGGGSPRSGSLSRLPFGATGPLRRQGDEKLSSDVPTDAEMITSTWQKVVDVCPCVWAAMTTLWLAAKADLRALPAMHSLYCT